jgi:hypothetical protein
LEKFILPVSIIVNQVIMPEFKEESDLSVVDGETSFEVRSDIAEEESESMAAENAANPVLSDEERARCALKRGRLPVSAVQKKANSKFVCVDDVCKDAIGTRKNGQTAVQKSTAIVEKNTNSSKKDSNRADRSCKKHAENVDADQEDERPSKCTSCECKCGVFGRFIKKVLSFLGLRKEGERCEQKPRQYRRRSHNQRRGNSHNSSHSTN